MSSDISVSKVEHQVEDRSWLASSHGTGPGENPSVTLDTTLFVQATHYPNGYVRSGMVVAKVTATGLYGPYDSSKTNGQEVAAGHLYASVNVRNRDGSLKPKAATGLLVHGFVTESKLPTNHGLTSPAKTTLKHIIYL